MASSLAMRFARTKIQPPRPRGALIERPALERSLAEAVRHSRLVLIAAPAGCGKTAALARLMATLPDAVARAWVALDEEDDLGRVAACLVAALEPLDLPWRIAPEALIQSAQEGERAGRQALVAGLVNALAAAEARQGLIVLDDAHRVEDPAVFDFLDGLLERLPPGWCVVIASRTDPPLALARLRANGELAELRQSELGFDAQEVAALVRVRAPAMREGAALALHERTQGWAAGLALLLADAGAPRAAAASSVRDRHVFDYLASEVLAGLPEALQQFLLRCSVLPEWSAERCAALSGDAQAALRLEEIERRGLFASVIESEPLVLKLHDLFRGFLEDRLRRDSPQAFVQALRQAAATEPDALRCVGLLLRAGAWEEAADTLQALARDTLTAGHTPALQRLVQQFPAEVAARLPKLQLVRALVAWAQWDWLTMQDAAERAADRFDQAGDAAGRQRALTYLCVACSAVDDDERCDALLAPLLREPMEADTRCRALLVESWQAQGRGDLDRLAAAWNEVVDRLHAEDLPLPCWYECGPLPTFVGMPGLRQALRRWVDGVRARLPEQTVPLAAMAQAFDGWLRLWAGDREGALALLHAAEEDCRWVGSPSNAMQQVIMLRCMAHALAGEVALTTQASLALVELAQQQPAGPARDIAAARFAFFAGRHAAVAGDTPGVQRWCGEVARRESDPEWQPDAPLRALADGYLKDAQGDTAGAAEDWQRALAGGGFSAFGQRAELQLRIAAVRASQGRWEEAKAGVQPVLAQAQASGECAPLLAAGPSVLQRLLDALPSLQLEPSLAGALRDAAALSRAWRGEATASVAEAAPDDRLSAREREVLERLAAGDSNKLIARAFELSPHTVKRHVSNILDKLALQSRGQAAAWFNERRLSDAGSR